MVEPARDAGEVADGLSAVRDRTVAEIEAAYSRVRCCPRISAALREFRLVVQRLAVESFEMVHGRLQLHVDLEPDRSLLGRRGRV